ncbi:molybdopterin-dependent oxidoreductase [Glaciihabitans sp. UYNi722]|uniref:molybdopterin-dependent oxidoreductase n=1 Tax=Glaciihabitans sp. UYNi722 TaxID=3156344 RepID=UPI003394BC96
MAVVLGRLLGSAFIICFGTGLYSHFLQDPLPWMVFPTRPQTLYQLTQGIHITAGIACFPLLFGKLYSVFPELFQTPPIKNFANLLERASIAIFVAASLVQISTGLLNTYQWYPFPFPFRQTHFALSFVIIGSLAIHIAVKLPLISRYWTRKRSIDADGDLMLDDEDRPLTHADVAAELAATTPEPVGPISRRVDGLTGRVMGWIDSAPPRQPKVSRRGFIATISIATAAVVTLTAGQSFRFLEALNIFAPRKHDTGPNSLPINRTAKAAQISDSAVGSDWQLAVSRGDAVKLYSYSDLTAMTQYQVDLPISCVEGWSQMASWRGVRLRDLMDGVGAHPDEDLRLTSLEVKGGYRVTEMGSEYVQDDLTLVALQLNGDKLDIDHGYPARIIAPGRPGVLQTKWLSKLEVI